ncbi:hypothetical protein ACF053_27450 [Streptomyces kanasensis]|uniref:hypothetical protein n=1 Tax=Streptomyces kanasensis TaxID=936756 RepID=UPI0036F72CE5
MDLQGGMVRAKNSKHDWLSFGAPSSSCSIYREHGPGKATGLFTLELTTSDSSEPLHVIGDASRVEPFFTRGSGRGRDITAAAERRPESWPVGDGTLGWYGNWYTIARAECGPGSREDAPELLHVKARADYQDVPAEDRDRLTRIARSATAELADRLGCRTRLPALPDAPSAPVPSALRPARTAEGTCSWFARHIRERGQGRLPDRALAVPARTANPADGCLLAASPEQVGRIAEGLAGERLESARDALTISPWWLRAASYFGAEAGSVGYQVPGGEVKRIEAGTGGHTIDIWWASSLCGGKPALHTLSSNYPYGDVVGSRAMSDLFRAYVADTAKRRGCTRVADPGSEGPDRS